MVVSLLYTCSGPVLPPIITCQRYTSQTTVLPFLSVIHMPKTGQMNNLLIFLFYDKESGILA